MITGINQTVQIAAKVDALHQYAKRKGGYLTVTQSSLITAYILAGWEMRILPEGETNLSLVLMPLPRGNFYFQVMRGGDQAELDAMIAAVQ